MRGRNAFQFPRGLGLCAGDELKDQGMDGFLPVAQYREGVMVTVDKCASLSRREVALVRCVCILDSVYIRWSLLRTGAGKLLSMYDGADVHNLDTNHSRAFSGKVHTYNHMASGTIFIYVTHQCSQMRFEMRPFTNCDNLIRQSLAYQTKFI